MPPGAGISGDCRRRKPAGAGAARGAYFTSKLQELVSKFDIATEARGVGAIQALQLNIPADPVLHGTLADGLLINVTQESVLRFLPPFLLQEKQVDAGVHILKRQLAAAQKAAKSKPAA